MGAHRPEFQSDTEGMNPKQIRLSNKVKQLQKSVSEQQLRFEAFSSRLRKSSERASHDNKVIADKKESVKFNKLRLDLDRMKGSQVTTLMQN